MKSKLRQIVLIIKKFILLLTFLTRNFDNVSYFGMEVYTSIIIDRQNVSIR